MAFPVIQEAIESNTTTAGTSHVVTLPTATANQLLLIILDKGSTAASINAHTELTELLDENLANGLYIAYRWMNGSEPASYTLVSSASTRSARIAYRISETANPATQAPEIGTTGTGTSATPDPPASATPGSTKDFLFIAFYGAAGEEADDDTWSDSSPTSYTPSPPRMKSCGVAGTNLGGLLAAAERANSTGTTENPGTFAKDTSAAWRSQTIMIHPSASQTFQQALVAVAVGVASLSTLSTYLRTLVSTAIGVAVLTPATVFVRTLAATAVGGATLATALLTSVSMAATALGIATLTRIVTYSRILAATAVAVASLTKGMFVTLSTTAIGVTSLTKGMFKTLAATVVGAPALATTLLASVTMAATALGAATLIKVVTFAQSIAAAALSVASLTKTATFFRGLSAVATGIVTLATQLIEESRGGVGATLARGIRALTRLNRI